MDKWRHNNERSKIQRHPLSKRDSPIWYQCLTIEPQHKLPRIHPPSKGWVPPRFKEDEDYTQIDTQFYFVCLVMYNKIMIYSFQKALEIFGFRDRIRKALAEKRLFVAKRGFYSDEKPLRDEASLSLFYPETIFPLTAPFSFMVWRILFPISSIWPPHELRSESKIRTFAKVSKIKVFLLAAPL